jgi:hypothetical protein
LLLCSMNKWKKKRNFPRKNLLLNKK